MSVHHVVDGAEFCDAAVCGGLQGVELATVLVRGYCVDGMTR